MHANGGGSRAYSFFKYIQQPMQCVYVYKRVNACGTTSNRDDGYGMMPWEDLKNGRTRRAAANVLNEARLIPPGGRTRPEIGV